MAKKSGGENEYHVVGVRMRVVGTGNLQIGLQDLDNIQTQALDPIIMQPATRFEPTKLSNFQSQRVRFTGITTEINEIFRIHRIVLFAKPVAVEYPM